MNPTRTLAAASLTVLAVLVTPMPAFADQYPPSGGAAVVNVACASTFSAAASYFDSNETVTIEIVAEKSGAVVSTSQHAAAADGSLEYALPTASGVAGQYELTTWGASSPTRGPLLYSPAPECLVAASAVEQSSQPTLPNTGADLSALWLSTGLIFSGLLALGAVHLVRRRSV